MIFQNKSFEIDKYLDEIKPNIDEKQKENIKVKFTGVTKLGDLENWVKDNQSDKEFEDEVRFALEVLSRENEKNRKSHEELKKISEVVSKTAIMKSRINIIVSIIFFLAGGFFFFKFLNFNPKTIAEIEIGNVINIFTLASFWVFVVHFLYLIIGFVLILFGVNTLKRNTFLKDYSGISKIQNEVRTGLGETRPLIQVIQETLTNANKTFTLSLTISKALFWTGLVFLSIALFQILVLGRTSYSAVEVGVSGGIGILSWIVSTLLSQRKAMQDNLDNITQLEFTLVGIKGVDIHLL